MAFCSNSEKEAKNICTGKRLARSASVAIKTNLMCSILSLWTAIKGYLFKFGLFTFGRALSSQPTPYQVLKLKLQKLQKLQKDNDDDSTQDCRFLRFTFTFLHDVQNIAPGHK